MVIYLQQFLATGGRYMRGSASRIHPGMFLFLLASLFLFAGSFSRSLAAEAESTPPSKESFNLILPFKHLTVGQGQEVTMDSEVVNRRKDPVDVSLTLDGIPKGWEVNFSSRYPSFPIRSVQVAGEKSTTVEFKAKVPEATRPGEYKIRVAAKDLPGTTQYNETIVINVTSKKVATGGLTLTSQYPVLTTGSGQPLKFTVDLKNDTNKPLTTSMAAQAPPGWTVRFKPQFGDQQISSIQLKENGSETLSVEIDTPVTAEAKEYPLTIQARAGAFEAAANLKISLRGTQDLRLITASGTLSFPATAGTKAPVDIIVGNVGTAPIKNLGFVTKKPNDKWTVEFKPEKIDALNPGEVKQITMEVLAPERTVAGDYMLGITANSPDTTRSYDFRVTLSTPTVWGWIGFGIVGLVVLGLAAVFFRLGRR